MRRHLRNLHASLWLILGPALALIAVLAFVARPPEASERDAPAGVYSPAAYSD